MLRKIMGIYLFPGSPAATLITWKSQGSAVEVTSLLRHPWRSPSASVTFPAEDGMNILAAIKREEQKLEKQVRKLQHQLDGVRAAAKALGHSANRDLGTVKKRVLSAAGRAKIAAAARKRWAKVRAQAKKAVS
jgi:hypothetical protein